MSWLKIWAFNLVAVQAFACGVEWKKPKTHFDGVNEMGHVSYWDKLGEIDLGGEVFPLVMGFRSDWQQPSPYLGHGWMLGLLDSHFVQRDPGAFDMIAPDGYTVPFGRDPKNPAILNGAKGWKAELKGESIIVHASCGWKLRFERGRIVAITTPKNRTVEIQRDAEGVATGVVEGANVVMKVRRASGDRLTELVIGEKVIRIEQVDRPIIHNVGGLNVVGARSHALGKVILQDGLTKEFGYEPNGELQPTLSIANPGLPARVITWNPVDGVIISDDSWKYEIGLPGKPGQNAAIGRRAGGGLHEFWFYDATKGEEKTISGDGLATTKRWFTSGTSNGKLRSIESIGKDGSVVSSTRLSYDEKGNLIRKVDPTESFTRLYSEDGKTAETISLDGKVLYRETFDEQNRVVERTYNDGKVDSFSYIGGETKKLTRSPGGPTTEILISGGKVMSHKLLSDSGEIIKDLLQKHQPLK